MSEKKAPCTLNLSRETLSAWRDRLLPEADAQRVALHVSDCAACQYRLSQFALIAAAIQRQPAPDLRAQTWRGIQMRLETTQRAGFPRNFALRGVGAALAAVLVAMLIFVFVTHNQGGTHTLTTTPTGTAAATTQPTPASSFLTPTQAWGNFPSQNIALTQGVIYPEDIFPDTSAYVGTAVTASQADDVDVISLPSKNIRRVYTSPAGVSITVRTDGRYIAWLGGQGFTGGGPAPAQIVGYVDLQSGHVTTLFSTAQGQGFAVDPTQIAVDHGIFVWARINTRSEDLNATDMATGKTTTITANSLTPPFDAQVSWPYVLYQNAGNEHLFNLQTGSDSTLTGINFGALDGVALDGTTVFWLHKSQRIVLDEIDHIDQPNASARAIVTLPANGEGNLGGITASNRLVVWNTFSGLYAWDRVLGKLVQLNPANYFAGYVSGVHGNGLFYPSGSNVVNGNLLASQYTFVNTSQLPTR